MSQSIISSISRSDTFPKQIPITITGNKGYISIKTTNWTPQMFYELPIIQFDIYADINGTKAKTPFFSKSVNTYNAMFPGKQNISISIPLKNTSENCYLYITPIFDNNAVAARNELIKNGIETGQIWDTVTDTFSIDISFIDKDGSSIIETITGIPPLTFRANGQPLASWSISGNTLQAGTPTPDNPIYPEFVGERTSNLYDGTTSATNARLSTYGTGTYAVQGYSVSSYIPINPSTKYCTNLTTQSFYCLYNENKYFLVGGIISKTTPSTSGYANAKFIRFDFPTDNLPEVQLSEGALGQDYEPYGYKLPLTCGSQTTPIYLGQVQTIRQIKKLVLDGTESTWLEWNGFNLFRVPDMSRYYRSQVDGAICDSLPLVMRNDLTTNTFCWSAGTVGEFIININNYNLADLKTYLNSNPITVWYVLETPETDIVNEPLAKIGDYADTVASTNTGAPSIPTVKGQNTLTVDTELQPSNVSITYTK